MPSTIAAAKDPEIEPKSADRHDDQHVDEIGERKRGIESDDLDSQRATESGQTASKRERDRERSVDVDAETAGHAFIVDGRAHLGAESGVFDAQHQGRGDRQREPDQDQAIYREANAHEGERGTQIGRQLQRLLIGTEECKPPPRPK